MAINETITLQGVPQVKEQLAEVTKASQQTSAAINQIGGEAAAAPIQNIFVQLKQGTETMKATTTASNDLKLATRALKAPLSDLGVSFGPISGFARLASASFGLFAASFTGATIISLTKFNEQLLITKDRLDVLSGGTKAFQTVENEAKRLGIPIQDLAANVEALGTAFAAAGAKASTVKFVGDLPEAANKFSEGTKLATALSAQLQAAGVSAENSSKAIAKFADDIRKNSAITGDAIRALADASPRVAQAFAQLFGGTSNIAAFAAQLDKVPLSLQKVQLTLNSARSESDKFFNPQPITEMTGQLIELSRNFEGLKERVAPAADAISTVFIKALNSLVSFLKTEPFQNLAVDLVNPIGGAINAAFKNINFSSIAKTFSDGLSSELAVSLAAALVNPFSAAISKAIDAINFRDLAKKISDALSAAQTETPFNLGTGFEAPSSESLSTSLSAIDRIKTGFNQLQQTGTQSATNINNSWKNVVSQVSTGVGSALSSATNDAKNFGRSFVDALSDIGTQATKATKQVQQVTTTFAGGTSTSFGKGAFATVPGTSLPDQIKSTVDSSKSLESTTNDVNSLTQAFQSLQTAISAAAEGITSLGSAISGVDVSSFTSALQQAANISFSSLASQVQQLASALQQATANASQLSASMPATFDQRFQPFASGGLILGPGTGTSDSILARLSSGEFVISAAATRHWGAAFLDALNSMRAPMMPRFAAGGAVTSAGSPVHLHIDTTSFELTASENVASALRKHAVKSRLVSTGRKPSWY